MAASSKPYGVGAGLGEGEGELGDDGPTTLPDVATVLGEGSLLWAQLSTALTCALARVLTVWAASVR